MKIIIYLLFLLLFTGCANFTISEKNTIYQNQNIIIYSSGDINYDYNSFGKKIKQNGYSKICIEF